MTRSCPHDARTYRRSHTEESHAVGAPAATVLVVLGATGDLMSRKIAPSLFYLYAKGLLPERFGSWASGAGRGATRPPGATSAASSPRSTPTPTPPRSRSSSATSATSTATSTSPRRSWTSAATSRASTTSGGRARTSSSTLPSRRTSIPRSSRTSPTAGSPRRAATTTGWTRILIEKPFGDDEESGRALDAMLQGLFLEEQIYRIDHYLAKEMLQGIMNFRFENNLFETSWSREAIERIEIDLLEDIGIGSSRRVLRRRGDAARRRPEPPAADARAGHDGPARVARARRHPPRPRRRHQRAAAPDDAR